VVSRGELPGGGGEAEHGNGRAVAVVDGVADLCAHQGLVAEVVVAGDELVPQLALAGLAEDGPQGEGTDVIEGSRRREQGRFGAGSEGSNSHYQFILDFLLVWADFQSDCGLFCLRGGDRRPGRLFGKVGGCDGSQERAPVLEHGVVDHGANVIQQSIPRSLCQEASSFAIASTMGRASSAVMPDFSRGS